MPEPFNIARARNRRPTRRVLLLLGPLALAALGARCTAAPDNRSAPPAAEAPVDTAARPPAQDSAHTLLPPLERRIIPGVRVGRITWETSRERLGRMWGAALVRDSLIPMGEGETAPGTVVAAATDSTLAIVWTDSARAHPREVRGVGAAYRTAEGIGRGSTLEEVEAAVGPFKLLGFGWDYGGTMLFEGTRRGEWNGLLILRFTPRDPATTSSPAYRRVVGDRPYPSDSPDVRALGLVVREVIVRLQP